MTASSLDMTADEVIGLSASRRTPRAAPFARRFAIPAPSTRRAAAPRPRSTFSCARVRCHAGTRWTRLRSGIGMRARRSNCGSQMERAVAITCWARICARASGRRASYHPEPGSKPVALEPGPLSVAPWPRLSSSRALNWRRRTSRRKCHAVPRVAGAKRDLMWRNAAKLAKYPQGRKLPVDSLVPASPRLADALRVINNSRAMWCDWGA